MASPRGIKVADASHNGFTGMMAASQGGAVTKQLLDHGAEVAVATHDGVLR